MLVEKVAVSGTVELELLIAERRKQLSEARVVREAKVARKG